MNERRSPLPTDVELAEIGPGTTAAPAVAHMAKGLRISLVSSEPGREIKLVGHWWLITDVYRTIHNSGRVTEVRIRAVNKSQRLRITLDLVGVPGDPVTLR